MKNVIVRSLSGLVYVALIIGSILLGQGWFVSLMAIFAVLAVYEMSSISAHLTGRAEAGKTVLFPYTVIIDAVAAASIVASAALVKSTATPLTQVIVFMGFGVLFLYLPLRITLGLYELRGQSMRTRFATIAMSVMGVIYVSVPLLLLCSLYSSVPMGNDLVMCIFILIWLNDTGAFCFGSTLGKRRLWEELSPKKSWEGFWGGMACCILFGVMCYFCFDYGELPLWAWIVLGILVSAMSTWGDLFESMMKRAAGVKDSSHLIPGHGGILDRIDSLLLVAPVAAYFLFMYFVFSF